MPASAVDVIGPAFQHAKQQLFTPFGLGQWTRLAVVGLLAGELSSGGCNFGAPFGTGNSSRDDFLAQAMPAVNPVIVAALITLLIVCGVVVWLILLYVNSMMRFVLFDSVVARQCRIRRFWKDRRGVGFKYFVWQVGFSLVTLLSLAFVIGVPLVIAFGMGLFNNPRENLVRLLLGGVILFLMVIVMIVGASLTYVFTKDFVVPQMACEGVAAIEGWRRLWPMLKADKGGYTVYIVLKMVLALAVAIIFFLVMMLALLVLLIPAGGVGVVALLTGHAAGLTWNIFTITIAVVAGIIVLAAVLYLAALIFVPAIVFFPAYSIYFFASRYGPLDTLVHRPTPAPPSPASTLSL